MFNCTILVFYKRWFIRRYLPFKKTFSAEFKTFLSFYRYLVYSYSIKLLLLRIIPPYSANIPPSLTLMVVMLLSFLWKPRDCTTFSLSNSRKTTPEFAQKNSQIPREKPSERVKKLWNSNEKNRKVAQKIPKLEQNKLRVRTNKLYYIQAKNFLVYAKKLSTR